MANHPPPIRAHPLLKEVPDLDSIDTELSDYDTTVVFAATEDAASHDVGLAGGALDADEIAFELGVWISGLMQFPRVCVDAFRDRGESGSADRSREFRISLLGLQHCSTLVLNLRKLIGDGGDHRPGRAPSLSTRDVEQLSEQLRSLILLNRSVSGSPRPAEWHAWSVTLEH